MGTRLVSCGRTSSSPSLPDPCRRPLLRVFPSPSSDSNVPLVVSLYLSVRPSNRLRGTHGGWGPDRRVLPRRPCYHGLPSAGRRPPMTSWVPGVCRDSSPSFVVGLGSPPRGRPPLRRRPRRSVRVHYDYGPFGPPWTDDPVVPRCYIGLHSDVEVGNGEPQLFDVYVNGAREEEVSLPSGSVSFIPSFPKTPDSPPH